MGEGLVEAQRVDAAAVLQDDSRRGRRLLGRGVQAVAAFDQAGRDPPGPGEEAPGAQVSPDEAGNEVTTITAYVGRGNLLRFRTSQTGLSFATFSIYVVDENNVLQTYEGNFYVESWTPQEIRIVDDNLRTSGEVEYSFVITMRSGTTYFHHDPKIQNRSSLPPSGVTA